MKLFNLLYSYVKSFDKKILYIIKVIYFIVITLMIIGLMCISCASNCFANFDTALFWMGECLIAANKIASIGLLLLISYIVCRK